MLRAAHITLSRRVMSRSPLACHFATAATAAVVNAPPPSTRVQASLKLYREHILVASRQPVASWPKRVELAAPPAQDAEERLAADGAVALAQMAHAAGRPGAPMPAPTLTLVDVSGGGEAGPFHDGDALLFSASEAPLLMRGTQPTPSGHVSSWKPQSAASQPQEDSVSVQAQNLITGQLLSDASQHQLLRQALQLRGATLSTESAGKSLLPTPVAGSLHLLALVCCHGQRDTRCGDRGPLLVAALRDWASQGAPAAGVQMNVLPCSHIGGHEFAGNVLLYAWRAGTDAEGAAAQTSLNDWFGLVPPALVPELMSSYTLFARSATAATDSSAVQQLRRQLLQHPLPPVASTSPDTCSTCEPNQSAAGSAAPFVPTRLAQLWRGGMGIDKATAKQIGAS